MDWIDINPRQWFYRSVLEAKRIYLDKDKEVSIFNSYPYNVFETGKERRVEVFISDEGQKEFEIPGFIPDPRMEVLVYIDGALVFPSHLENDYVHLPNPIAGGKEVIIVISGVPAMRQDSPCRQVPHTDECSPRYPSAVLSQSGNYTFNINYSPNEVAVALGRTLKRVNVQVAPNETIQQALERVIGLNTYQFTVINGVVYVSYHLKDIPLTINYNYMDGGVVKHMIGERITPTSDCVLYNDRFFPDVNTTRAEFLVLLDRVRENLYNRYTDRGYVSTASHLLTRDIKDIDDILSRWYAEPLLNILNEKYLDGCYVFPLYEDGRFVPEDCITRAEAVVYLHRFTEWALERFR